MRLQQIALQFLAELNAMTLECISRIVRVGYRGHGLKCAATLLYARQRAAKQARMLLKQVEQAMKARAKTPAVLARV